MSRFISVLLLVTACANNPIQLADEPLPDLETAQGRAGLDQTLQLRPNQVAATEDGNLFVTFRAIDSDSRCPVDVTCIWAGNAAARIGTATTGGSWTEHILNSTLDPQQVTVGQHTVELIDVIPENRQGVRIRPSDYRIVLRVTRS